MKRESLTKRDLNKAIRKLRIEKLQKDAERYRKKHPQKPETWIAAKMVRDGSNQNLTAETVPDVIEIINDNTGFIVEFKYVKRIVDNFFYIVSNIYNAHKTKLPFKPNSYEFIIRG